MILGKFFGGSVSNFSKWALKTGKFPKQVINKVTAHATKYGDDIFPNISDLEDLSLDLLKQTEMKAYTLTRRSELTSGLTELQAKSHKASEAIPGAIEAKINYTSSISSETDNAFNTNLELDLDSLGPNFLKFWNKALGSPHKLKAEEGIGNRELYVALSDPKYAKNETLQKIGALYRKHDEQLLNDMSKSVPIGVIDTHVVPLSPKLSVVESLGSQNFGELLHRYTILGRETAQKIADTYFESVKSYHLNKTRIKFNSRSLKFREGEQGLHDQYELYKYMTGLNEETGGILEKALAHKRRLIQDFYFLREFGDDPEGAILSIKNSLLEHGQEQGFVDELNKGLKRTTNLLNHSMGNEDVDESGLLHLVEGVDKLTSATIGTPLSLVRNATIDYPGHSASMKNAIMTGEGYPGILWNRIAVPISIMFQNVANKLTGQGLKTQKALNGLLDLYGFATTNNAMFSAQGLKGVNLYDDFLNLNPNASLAEKLARRFNSAMGSFNHTMNSLAGNITHFDATTMVNLVNHSAFFSEMVLKHSNYKYFIEAMPFDETYLKGVFGIDGKVFQALKESYETIAVKVNPSKVNKVLGHRPLKVLVPKTIEKMDDSIAIKYKDVGETAEAFKNRVRISYQALLTHQRNMTQSNLYKANRVTRVGITRGGFMDLLSRLFGKFVDINHTQQYHGLRAGASMVLYGNPFHGSYGSSMVVNRKSIEHWSKVMAWYTALGTVNTWTRDLLDGRTPRELTARQMALIVAGSGVGGIPLMFVTPFLYAGHKSRTGFYGSTPFGNVSNSLIESIEAFHNKGLNDRSLYKFSKFLQMSTGVGRLWWTGGLTKYMMMHGILDTGARNRIERWYRNELKSEFIME